MAELRSLLEQRFSCRPEVRACGAEITRETKQHDVDSYRIKNTKKMQEMGGKRAVPRNAKATRRCVFKRSVRGMILITQLVHQHTAAAVAAAWRSGLVDYELEKHQLRGPE